MRLPFSPPLCPRQTRLRATEARGSPWHQRERHDTRRSAKVRSISLPSRKEKQNPTLFPTYPLLGGRCQSRFLEPAADERQSASGELARRLNVRLYPESTTVAHHVDNEAEHGFRRRGVPLVLEICGQVERYTTITSQVLISGFLLKIDRGELTDLVEPDQLLAQVVRGSSVFGARTDGRESCKVHNQSA